MHGSLKSAIIQARFFSLHGTMHSFSKTLPVSFCILATGCTTISLQEPVVEINSTGVPMTSAVLEYDDTYSRASNIGAVFQCPVADIDPVSGQTPNSEVMSATDGYTRPYAGGTLSELDPAIKQAIETAAIGPIKPQLLSGKRHDFDQWWALLPLSEAVTPVEAAVIVHRDAVRRTDRALELSDYYVIPVEDSVLTDIGNGNLRIVSTRRIVREKSGCPQPKGKTDGCWIVTASTTGNWTAETALPKWFGSVGRAWAVSFIPVVAAGKRADGSWFELPEIIREDIARESSDGFFFHAPARTGKPGFVGEKKYLRYAVLTEERQERLRRKNSDADEGGLAELWEKTKSDIRDVFRSGF